MLIGRKHKCPYPPKIWSTKYYLCRSCSSSQSNQCILKTFTYFSSINAIFDIVQAGFSSATHETIRFEIIISRSEFEYNGTAKRSLNELNWSYLLGEPHYTFGIQETYITGHVWYIGSWESTESNLFPSYLQPCNNKPSIFKTRELFVNSEAFQLENRQRFSKHWLAKY